MVSLKGLSNVFENGFDMMKISFSSFIRYAPNVSHKENSESYLQTAIFGFVERRFIKGLIIHKAIEILLARYDNSKISDLSFNNQEMYDCGDDVLNKCLDSNDEMYYQIRKSLRKYLRHAKQMLLNQNRNYTIYSIEAVYSMRVNQEIQIIAKPDMVLISDNQMRIVDWKTQSIANTRTDNEQLSIYKMVLENNFPDYTISTYSAYLEIGRWTEEWHTDGYQEQLIQDIISAQRT